MGDETPPSSLDESMGEGDPVASLLAARGFADETTAPPTEEFTGPLATTHQVLQCQLSSWYPTFSNMSGLKRKKVTIQSVIIDSLPVDFKDYVLSDGVQLPLGAHPASIPTTDSDWSDDDNDGDDENDDSDGQKQFHFPQLNQQIQSAISTLGGSVLPKLNWSAPKDATWVNGGSLKCENPGDVYVLIKSSDFCLHDVLRNALKDCDDYDQSSAPPPLQLVLRKWCNLHPSMEFRCFVRDHELLAISQRNHTQHYPHLMQDAPRIRDKLLDFFEDYVRERFADGTVENYVLDVYMDQKDRVWILDFNIWARSTDSLLFEWPELLTIDGDEEEPVFKIVETAQQVRQDPLASYRAPIDTVDLANMTQGDAKQFEEFMKQCRKPSELDEED